MGSAGKLFSKKMSIFLVIVVVCASTTIFYQRKILPHVLSSALRSFSFLPFEGNSSHTLDDTDISQEPHKRVGAVSKTATDIPAHKSKSTIDVAQIAGSEGETSLGQSLESKLGVREGPTFKNGARQTSAYDSNIIRTSDRVGTSPQSYLTEARQKVISTTDVVLQNRKTILYICNEFGCGGLADRQKGIVSAYVLAAMLKRNFKVHVTVPCDLGNFMVPNKMDWRVSKEKIRKMKLNQVRVIDHSGVDYVMDLLQQDDLDPIFPDEYTSFFWNMELVQYLRQHRLAKQVPWLVKMSVPDVYRFVLNTLFSLKPEVQKELDNFRNSVPEDSKLVCAQIRLGNQPGFYDVEKYYTLDQFPIVAQFLRGFNDTDRYRFLVTSDSQELVSMTETSFPNRTLKIPGPITHVDKARGGNACDGLRKAILDEYALATCDVLVISESGLGKIAAFRRGTDKDLFLFLGSTIEPVKRDSPFPKNKLSWKR